MTNTTRLTLESYCYQCDRIWSGRNAGVAGKTHAERLGHRVRVTRTIVQVFNVNNGKAKVKNEHKS
jgi:hypothetical protein